MQYISTHFYQESEPRILWVGLCMDKNPANGGSIA